MVRSVLAGAALALYLVVVAVIVLEPSNALPSTSIVRILDALRARGVPDGLATFGSVEVVTNVLLFVPVSFLGLAAVPRLRWWGWVAAAAALSVMIELVQGAFLPARTPSVSDVAANLTGAVVGVLALGLLSRAARRLRRG
ncbi:MAG: VanZ family protein [Nocardioidaceae bacterium]|nr:VanZ family protein [Nocardioidaceae bacterium]